VWVVIALRVCEGRCGFMGVPWGEAGGLFCGPVEEGEFAANVFEEGEFWEGGWEALALGLGMISVCVARARADVVPVLMALKMMMVKKRVRL